MNTIKCEVFDCKYCDVEEKKCELKDVLVSLCSDECGCKEDTMCCSYKERK